MKFSKAQSRERWRQLRNLACEWDPIGVIPLGAPRDEYDCLVGPLLRLLEQGASEEQIARFLNDQMENHFGLANVTTRDFAARVRAWYHQHWPETTVQEGPAE